MVRKHASGGKAGNSCTIFGGHCLDNGQKMGRETVGKAEKRQEEVKNGKKTT
jgi:hypothetical protein